MNWTIPYENGFKTKYTLVAIKDDNGSLTENQALEQLLKLYILSGKPDSIMTTTGQFFHLTKLYPQYTMLQEGIDFYYPETLIRNFKSATISKQQLQTTILRKVENYNENIKERVTLALLHQIPNLPIVLDEIDDNKYVCINGQTIINSLKSANIYNDIMFDVIIIKKDTDIKDKFYLYDYYYSDK